MTSSAADSNLVRLVARAAAVVAVRGIAVRLTQLAGTLILARLLAPHTFGLFAFGLSTLAIASFLSDIGLGASLVRQKREPRPEELRTLMGIQLGVSTGLALLSWALVPLGGTPALIAAVMMTALPLASVRAPVVVELERRLEYRPIATAEVVETLSFFGWACACAYLQWGLWAIASAAVVRALAGSSTLLIATRRTLPQPGFRWPVARRMVAFGAKVQGVNAVIVARDQGVNLIVAAVAGLSVLGAWSLAYRVMQVPFLLFSTLWRVSFPAMARASDEAAIAGVTAGSSLVAVATGSILVPLVAVGPRVLSGVLGPEWAVSSYAIAIAASALAVSGPVSVATTGFLFARGDAAAVLKVMCLSTIVWLAVTAALASRAGVVGVAIGWAVSGLVEAFGFSGSVRKRSGVSVIAAIWQPATLTIGFLVVASVLAHSAPSLVLTLAYGAALTVAYLMISAYLNIGGCRRLISWRRADTVVVVVEAS